MAILVVLAVVLGELGGSWLLLDTLSHFRRQWVWLLLACGLGLVGGRRFGQAGLALLVAVGLSVTVYPLRPLPEPDPALGSTYRVLHFNMLARNERLDEMIAYILEADADFVFLTETYHHWRELQPLYDAYPGVVLHHRFALAGQVFLSRYPITRKEPIPTVDGGRPAVHVEIATSDGPLVFVGTHAMTPIRTNMFRWRNDHLYALGLRLGEVQAPLVVAGDFNCTPWATVFGDFTALAGVERARPQFSALPTWPTYVPLVRLPIDHLLGSDAIRFTSLHRMPYLGSDHFGIIAEFQIDAAATVVSGKGLE